MEEFERIADNVISRLRSVKCEFKKYVEGLRLVVERLQDELELAESELEGGER